MLPAPDFLQEEGYCTGDEGTSHYTEQLNQKTSLRHLMGNIPGVKKEKRSIFDPKKLHVSKADQNYFKKAELKETVRKGQEPC